MHLAPGIVDLALFRSAVQLQADQQRPLMPQSVLQTVFLTKQDELAEWCLRRVAGIFQPVREQVVTVRKPGLGVRPVSEWFVRDELLLRALVERLSPALRTPGRSAAEFDAFQQAPLGVADAQYVLSSDIAAFYQYVDYDLLSRELIARTGDAQAVDAIVQLLGEVTGKRFGLPQQNSASDVLAEAYIDVLERRLLRMGFKVWRYNDDFRVATASWSSALEAVDTLDREARSLGLTLNDGKTVIRKISTYKTSLGRREQVLAEIASEAHWDLAAIFASPYDGTPVDPDPGDVQIEAASRVLDRWEKQAETDPLVASAIVQLLPTALAQLVGTPATPSVLRICMELLRREQTVTPAVASYLTSIRPTDEDASLSAFTLLLNSNAYITPWQSAWLAPAFARMSALADGVAGKTRVAWLRSVWDSKTAPEPMVTAVAPALARHKGVTSEELLQAYDRVSETSRPAIALAVGVSGLAAADPRVKGLTDEDELIRWVYDWGALWP